MFECQHQSQVFRVEPRWVTLAYWETLPEAIASMRRVLSPWDGRLREADEYRIVNANKRGKVVETFDAYGKQTDGFRTRVQPGALPVKRKLVKA